MMLSGPETRLSKTIARQTAREASYALQTQAIFLPASLLGETHDLRVVLTEYKRRGYNTVFVPALVDGSILFHTDREGFARGRKCPGRKTLRLLAEYQFATHLYLDFLSAGPAGTNELGSLAKDHRDWLMKNSGGGFRISSAPDRPALFCWTSLQYRRFLGNILVDLMDAFPIDGLLFDVRPFPFTTRDPESWSHLGVNCLRRLRDELGVDLVQFLSEPSLMEFDRIVDWRELELEHFLENMKARVQKSRHHILTAALADLRKQPPYSPPWMKCYEKGTIEEVALLSTATDIAASVDRLDSMTGDRRPLIAAVENESELGPLGRPMASLPAHGFLAMEPDFENDPVFPPANFEWERSGPPELYPVQAAERILKRLLDQMDKADPLSLFFQELDEYFSSGGDTIPFRHLARLRTTVQMIRRLIVDESQGPDAAHGEIVGELDLVARILLLAPAPPIEY